MHCHESIVSKRWVSRYKISHCILHLPAWRGLHVWARDMLCLCNLIHCDCENTMNYSNVSCEWPSLDKLTFRNGARDPKLIQQCQNEMSQPCVGKFFYLYLLLEPLHPWHMSLHTRHKSQPYRIGMTQDMYINELFSIPFIHPCNIILLLWLQTWQRHNPVSKIDVYTI